jgi:hypothetical protein
MTVQQGSLESEVDRILTLFWKMERRVRRELWIPVVIFICGYIATRKGWIGIGSDPVGRKIQGLLLSMLVAQSWVSWRQARFYVLQRKHGPAIVLWIRRFHVGRESRRRLRLWELAVVPWGKMITLTDEAVSQPSLVIRTLIVGSIAVIPICGLFLWPFSDFSGAFGSSLVALIVNAILVYLARRTSRAVIERPSDIEKIRHKAQAMRREKVMISYSQFVHCVRDREEMWQMAIRELGVIVDVVLFDYGQGLSSSIEWELETLSRTCTPGKVVIAVPQESGLTDAQAASSYIALRFKRFFTEDRFPQVFAYAPQIHKDKFLVCAQRAIGTAALTPRRDT